MNRRANGARLVLIGLLVASLSSGCRSFYEVRIERESIEEADLARETVRVRTEEGHRVFVVTEVCLPPDPGSLSGGYLEGKPRGQIKGDPVRVYFDDLQQLEVQGLSFLKNTGVVLATVGGAGLVVAVAFAIAVATVAASL